MSEFTLQKSQFRIEKITSLECCKIFDGLALHDLGWMEKWKSAGVPVAIRACTVALC